MNFIQRLRAHPTGFWFVFWGELAERASYYGMRTVLALYMVQVLGFRENRAALVMTVFIACCYGAPLLGGWIADRYLGRFRVILYFSGPYVLGHVILGGWANRTALFVALALLALGAGSIKPNISTLMGRIYEHEKKEELLTEAFSYYYAAINIGSTISTISLPLVRDAVARRSTLERGYAVALTIPAILMVIAFFAFAMGRKHYPPDETGEAQRVAARAARAPKSPEQRLAERRTLLRISGVLALIAVYWFVYDQSASTWIFFAQRHTDLRVVGDFHVTADQIQGLGPFLIVVLTPLFNFIWGFARRHRRGRDVPDTRKMLVGFFIVIGCMATMSLAGFVAGTGRVSVWWVLVATLVITMSELCVSVVGLEFAFKQALPGTKSVVTGAFWLTVFLGDMVAGVFDDRYWGRLTPGMFFLVQAGMTVAAAMAFVVVARRFEQQGASAAV